MSRTQVDVADGEYSVIIYDDWASVALRRGRPCQDLTGNNLVYHLAQELHEAREELIRVKEDYNTFKQHFINTGVDSTSKLL